MTGHEWKQMQNTMEFIVEKQAEYAERFVTNEKRLDRLERLGETMMKAADKRFKRAELRLDRLEESLDRSHAEQRELRRDVTALVNSLRVSSRGDGERRR